MTPERNSEGIPEWGQRERLQDLNWIRENLHLFWPVATAAFTILGRGAIVADVTVRRAGGGHPFGYVEQAVIDSGEDEDMQRMVRTYDPEQEFVTVLLKTDNRTSTYRVLTRPRQT